MAQVENEVDDSNDNGQGGEPTRIMSRLSRLWVMNVKWTDAAAAIVVICAIAAAYHLLNSVGSLPAPPPPLSFAGSSENLPNSLVVPSLAAACDGDKNVIWCSTISMVWRQMLEGTNDRQLIVTSPGGPRTLYDFDADVESFDDPAAPQSENFETAATVASNSGDSIERINETARRIIGDAVGDIVPTGSNSGVNIVAAARFRVPFTVPFIENDDPFEFGSKKSRVESFGWMPWLASDIRGRTSESQVRVLFFNGEHTHDKDNSEFGLDLCRFSSPLQIVVARIPWSGSLLQTIRQCQSKIDNGLGPLALKSGESVIVPTIHFRVEHCFSDLLGSRIASGRFSGLPLLMAQQYIECCLDRFGAVVISRAGVLLGGTHDDYRPREFHFNKPFLVLMRERVTKKVVFALWVANSELLLAW